MNNTELKARPKMKILENAYNEIINTIGSKPAESGGLLFGKEDDMVVRKFVFDKHARTTRSTYTFNTEYLNPEIKKIYNEEGLSCIGFIHSHPHGRARLSPPDIKYFTSMFECMPRKHYITPIVFTVPDGGFKLNAHILPKDAQESISADVEILPDDYFQYNERRSEEHLSKSSIISFESETKPRIEFDAVVKITWKVWQLIFAFGITWFLFKILSLLTNYLNSLWL